MEDWLESIAVYAVIGLIAGFIAARVMKLRGNPVYYILLGVAGALVGGALGFILSIVFKVIMAVVGAIILIVLWRVWQAKKRWR